MSIIQYTTIKLPEDFVKQLIDPFVDDKSAGYSSRAEVIKTAVRDFSKKTRPEVPA